MFIYLSWVYFIFIFFGKWNVIVLKSKKIIVCFFHISLTLNVSIFCSTVQPLFLLLFWEHSVCYWCLRAKIDDPNTHFFHLFFMRRDDKSRPLPFMDHNVNVNLKIFSGPQYQWELFQWPQEQYFCQHIIEDSIYYFWQCRRVVFSPIVKYFVFEYSFQFILSSLKIHKFNLL